MAVIAAGGQLAASLGDEGLVTRKIEFGHGSEWVRISEQGGLGKVSDYSRLVTRSSIHLLNYVEQSIPEIVRSTTVRRTNERGMVETIITDFATPFSLRESLASASEAVHRSEESDEAYVIGNADYRLLVRTDTGIDFLNVRAFQGQEISVRYSGSTEIEPESPLVGGVLSTQAMRSGPLIEHLGGAHVLTEAGLVEIADELVVQVRSFPNSRRYGDTAIVVRDTCLEIVGFVDLDDYPRSAPQQG